MALDCKTSINTNKSVAFYQEIVNILHKIVCLNCNNWIRSQNAHIQNQSGSYHNVYRQPLMVRMVVRRGAHNYKP